MLPQWISRHSYSPVLSSDDSEAPLKPSMNWTNWLAPRRVRTALVLALLLALVFVVSRFSTLPERLHGFVPTNNQTSTPFMQQEQCNCSSPEPEPVNTATEPAVRWSDFAYVQYVTNENYLCNSLMILESLHRLGAKADRMMMYPEHWQPDNGSDASYPNKLLAQAKDLYGTKLVPIKVKKVENSDDPTWEDSYTKLLAFNQTQYKRVISLDSDATVRQHMDELFLLPSAPVAMPRAYWMDHFFLSSQLIVIEPSEFEWKRVEDAMNHLEGHDYDMDILNKMYDKSCLVIPHRRYDLLTGEFKGTSHENYLGSKEPWDARKALEEAKFVHFSDWPLPKPWLKPKPDVWEKHQPKCVGEGEQQDCSGRDVWLQIRDDFSERRQRICGHKWDNAQNERRSSVPRTPQRLKYEPVFS
ncbi:nucleotide-diphospho-sugar transferase [Lindgomyces ingoldianus]|uniref:Nucleotide-diphospho-sugar transferase n=1 Tax=Lindgomyces ingoldianus TaxID=673940 RepID=A0ACB6Q9Q8_9PLEO|nr:nucleotide-diphospho-sugar transferase [Lindgomyces ingoldianus]KAF2463684.1 nucleotide-diphospho-sugar transferase [Lindgomyces ingoldianus]